LFKAGEGKLLKMHANVFPYLAIFLQDIFNNLGLAIWATGKKMRG